MFAVFWMMRTLSLEEEEEEEEACSA